MNSETRTCTNCKTEKPAGDFYKSRRGYESRCKPCFLLKQSEYKRRAGEKVRERDREYRRRNGERASARQRQYYAERGRTLQKERRERNAEQVQRREREYRERNGERRREYRKREWRERRDAVSRRNSEYKRRDPAANRAREHRRRAAAGENGGSYTAAEWNALCEHFGNVCLSCGSAETTVDHVRPLSKGGRNDVDNLQPLCKSCNTRKGQRHVDHRDPARLAAFLSALTRPESETPAPPPAAASAALVPALARTSPPRRL